MLKFYVVDLTAEEKTNLKNTLALLFQKYLYDRKEFIRLCDTMIKKVESGEGVYLDYAAHKKQLQIDIRLHKRAFKRLVKMIDEN